MTDVFEGFPVDALVFLDDLATNNTTAYFDEHRARYDAFVLEPARAFVDELGALLRADLPDISADPRVDRSIFRIRRDTRFSKDKSPYKTNLAIILWEGSNRTSSPGIYVGIESTRVFVGGGSYQLDRDGLSRYRAAAAGSPGAELSAIEAELARGGIELRGRTYKRVPRGFDPEHPRAELLKHSGVWTSVYDGDPPAELHSPAFVEFVAEAVRPLLPLHRWLVAHVGG